MIGKLSILAALPALAIPAMAGAAPKQTEPKKKNVIFIITDDMRLDMTQYGGGKLQTPNLDALKAESVDFANACTTTGLSSPSRAALFTGRFSRGKASTFNKSHGRQISHSCSTNVHNTSSFLNLLGVQGA